MDGGGGGCRIFSRLFDLLAAGLDLRRLREELTFDMILSVIHELLNHNAARSTAARQTVLSRLHKARRTRARQPPDAAEARLTNSRL